jgi:hypothetical protein
MERGGVNGALSQNYAWLNIPPSSQKNTLFLPYPKFAFYLTLTVGLHTAPKPLAISSPSGDLSSTIVLESGVVPVAPKSSPRRYTNLEESISRQPRHGGVGSSCHPRPAPLTPEVTAVTVARPPKHAGSGSSVQLPCGSTSRLSLAAR